MRGGMAAHRSAPPAMRGAAAAGSASPASTRATGAAGRARSASRRARRAASGRRRLRSLAALAKVHEALVDSPRAFARMRDMALSGLLGECLPDGGRASGHAAARRPPADPDDGLSCRRSLTRAGPRRGDLRRAPEVPCGGPKVPLRRLDSKAGSVCAAHATPAHGSDSPCRRTAAGRRACAGSLAGAWDIGPRPSGNISYAVDPALGRAAADGARGALAAWDEANEASRSRSPGPGPRPASRRPHGRLIFRRATAAGAPA